MNHTQRVSLMLFLLFCGGTSMLKAQNVEVADLDSTFLALEQQWMAAAIEADSTVLEQWLDPGFRLTIGVPGGLVHVPRQGWLSNALNSYRIRSFTFDNISARLVADGVVVVTAYYAQDAAFDGQDVSGTYMLTDTWVQRGDAWKVLWRISSLPQE